jgi:hypothetical protein
MDLLQELASFAPIRDYRFGHTPLQIEYFKTVQQQGCPAFVYWQHVLQLKSLNDSMQELRLEMDELAGEIDDAQRWWPVWNRAQRGRKLPRLQFKLKKLNEAFEQKYREAGTTLEIIKTQFSDYTSMTEEEIFGQEKEYWTIRLGKQLVCSQLSRQLGVSEGSLEAVLSLPQQQQQEILQVLGQGRDTTLQLVQKKDDE